MKRSVARPTLITAKPLRHARGLSNADIAPTAHISEATVKSHIPSIPARLSLASRVQIVAHAYENGLPR